MNGNRAMKNYGKWVFVFAIFCGGLLACKTPLPEPGTIRISSQMRYELDWSQLLAEYVVDDAYDFSGLRTEAQRLNAIAASMQEVTREQYAQWDRGQQLAFLVNAHNVYAIIQILEHYPVGSFGQTRFLLNPYHSKQWPLLGERVSLRDLAERTMARESGEARACLLLNWGERGCLPPLPNAITAANLKDAIEHQAHLMMSDERYIRYEPEEHTLYVSALLDRYRIPIEREYTTLRAFIENYASDSLKDQMERRAPRIRFLPFETTLNEFVREPAE